MIGRSTMRLAVGSSGDLPPATDRLARRMLCPLTGMVQAVGFMRRDPMEPRLAIAGGEMTGVHALRGGRPPRAGAYHIGGAGVTYGEALIKTLGETVERYSHFAALAAGLPVTLASPSEMRASGVPAIVPDPGGLYTTDQLARPGFPFVALADDQPIGWVEGRSMLDGELVAVPAQQALVGYVRASGEPPFTAGVTTGSAAHTSRELALRNALLEIVQIDAAIGHWYGSEPAVRIRLDGRCAIVQRAIARTLHPHGPSVRFFWLPSADLPGMSIACLVESPELPRVGVGLGCDLSLPNAVYKAFLEGAAVAQLAKIVLFRERVEERVEEAGVSRRRDFYDLDSNVGHYAAGGDADALTARFPDAPMVAASDLPADVDVAPADDVALLVDAFAATGKRLVELDLTTVDVADLGFTAMRVWSPDTLSLPLPSAPPLRHRRFAAYGGAAHESPHPYP